MGTRKLSSRAHSSDTCRLAVRECQDKHPVRGLRAEENTSRGGDEDSRCRILPRLEFHPTASSTKEGFRLRGDDTCTDAHIDRV